MAETYKPFLKWVGGKRALLPLILSALPPEMNTYYEPFLGGGAVFFALCAERQKRFKHAVLADTNEDLIITYTCVRDNLAALNTALAKLAANHSAEQYYALRAQMPADPVERAARFIYLNKTCYNGLWRVNKAGQFNVPMGRYKNPVPAIIQPDVLKACSNALQGVELRCEPFDAVGLKAQTGDCIYADPPYAPLNEGSFNRYQSGGFDEKAQEKLRDLSLSLAGRGVSVMLSNADAPLIKRLYAAKPFCLHTVQAPRFVNSKGAARGHVTEVLITTYASPLESRTTPAQAA